VIGTFLRSVVGRTLPALALTLPASAAGEPRTAEDPAAWVSKRVQLWQPVAAERSFDEIGWASDLLEARRLAKEHHRPVFLFTHDGHMAVGRC
jgi:hypothetical protein